MIRGIFNHLLATQDYESILSSNALYNVDTNVVENNEYSSLNAMFSKALLIKHFLLFF